MPAGLPVFERLGVLGEIEAAGAQRWYGVKLWLNGTTFLEKLPKDRVAFPYGLSLRRFDLDRILLEAAACQDGVEVITNATVTDLVRRQGRVCGVRTTIGADQSSFEAAVTVLAGGRHTRLIRSAGTRTFTWPNRHTAYMAYISGIANENEPGLEGYYWHGRSASLLPADNGLRVAGVMAPPNSWPRETRGDRLLAELRRFPPLRERLCDARLIAEPVPVRGLRSVWRGPVAKGLLLIGDAGMQSDPLFGQGISWALRSADWAAEAIDAGLRAQEPASALRAYSKRRAIVFGHRFAAMTAVSMIEPGSMLERLVIANATVNPASTALVLRLLLGFGTVSRSSRPRRTLETWLREAIRTRSHSSVSDAPGH